MHDYRRDIDGLRALAVLSVVLFHFRVPGFSGGFAGVDVFFVISGFLITSLVTRELDAGSFSFAEFYERRARRLFPALYVMLTCCAVLAVFLLLHKTYDRFAKAFTAAVGFVANLYFWQTTDYFDDQSQRQPLLHTWSLAVEEQFYLGFPALLFVLSKWLPRKATWLVIGVGALASLGFAWHLAPTASSDVFYLPQYRVWELGLGALASRGVGALDGRRALAEASCALGLGLIVFSVVRLSETGDTPLLAAVLACAGTAAILVSTRATLVSRLLGTTPLVSVGLISYSLYLWHWPVWVFGRNLKLFPPTPLDKAMFVAGSMVLATLSWRFVERPFRGPKGVGTRHDVVLASALALCLAVVLAPRAFAALTPELPKKALAMLDAGNAYLRYRCMKPFELGEKCAIGKPNTPPTFVLWGDSHAMALAEGIDVLANEANRSGLVYSGSACAPLLGISNNGYDGNCIELGKRVTELLDGKHEIDTVILAARWAMYLPENWQQHEAGGHVYMRDDDARTSNELEMMEAGFDRSLAMLKRHRLRAVVVRQVPDIGWYVPEVMARALRLGRAFPKGPSLAEHRALQRRVNMMLDRVSKRHGAEIIDLTDRFCAGGTCRVQVDSVPLYRDDDHLSTKGAVWATSELPLFR